MSKGKRQSKTASKASEPSFMKPMQPDDALGAIVGKEPLPRTEVTKRMWDYIRQHNLQDPKDRRTIRADAKLRRVFAGKDSVSMFEVTKHVNVHMGSLDGDETPDSTLYGDNPVGYSLEGDSTTGYRKKKGR
jgi:upstream activation factor subunit UAF30